jgi:2-polyprenyl-3-methyl-5-hydroxy-6-metoxy-1,4-benzoquinol methylase
MTTYIFDNAWTEERRRLAALEAVFDPGTWRLLEARGVGPGWRCLEVGAGGGSIAKWLCGRVGPAGRVVATDLDTRFLDAIDRPNLEVRRHDLASEALPAAEFDLIHTRMVLQHLPDKPAALARLVAALRPGGWLVVEDMDFASAVADPAIGTAAAALFARMMDSSARSAATTSSDLMHGRRLFGLLTAAGLNQVGAEGRSFMWQGGSPGATAWRLSVAQKRAHFVELGLLTDAELDEGLALLADPSFVAISPLMMAVWGRRP